ncbi:hypothetical protein [Bacillus sp. JCM 19041]|uniref:hypothetical protein n=1 Tax=Bacillus sp. JCM 19041 TaxID=1460637 RepID=UPI0012E2DBE9
MKKGEFIDKPFEELTVDEFKSMMRNQGVYNSLIHSSTFIIYRWVIIGISLEALRD